MNVDGKGLDALAASRARFAELLEFCEGGQGAALELGDLEAELDLRGRELLGQLLADHLQLRAERQAGR